MESVKDCCGVSCWTHFRISLSNSRSVGGGGEGEGLFSGFDVVILAGSTLGSSSGLKPGSLADEEVGTERQGFISGILY